MKNISSNVLRSDKYKYNYNYDTKALVVIVLSQSNKLRWI